MEGGRLRLAAAVEVVVEGFVGVVEECFEEKCFVGEEI